MKKVFLLLIACSFLSACATQNEIPASGGIKVSAAYTYIKLYDDGTAPQSSNFTGGVFKSGVAISNINDVTNAVSTHNSDVSAHASVFALKQNVVYVNGIVKGNGFGFLSSATSGVDYAPATSGSAILKGNGSGGTTSASAGSDYAAPATTLAGYGIIDAVSTANIHVANVAPSIVAGAGAGTTPTISVTGTDSSFQITLITGTATPTGTIATVTFATAFSATPNAIFSPANPNAAALSATTACYGSSDSASFVLTSGTSALTDTTTYVWNVHVF